MSAVRGLAPYRRGRSWCGIGAQARRTSPDAIGGTGAAQPAGATVNLATSWASATVSSVVASCAPMQTCAPGAEGQPGHAMPARHLRGFEPIRVEPRRVGPHLR